MVHSATNTWAHCKRSRRLLKPLLGCLMLAVVLTASSFGAASAKVSYDEVSYPSSKMPVRQWQDTALKIKGVVVAVHGAARHSGTFRPLAERLASKGYVIVACDLRGHGQWYHDTNFDSPNKVIDYKQSVKDVVALVDQLRNAYGMVPIFVMGESAGAAVTIRAATECPEINGLILAAIGTRPVFHNFKTVWKDVVEGAKHFSQPIDVRPFMANYASDDPRVCAEMANDPRGREGMTPRELLDTELLIRNTPAIAAKLPEHLPVLMLQGDKDQIVSAKSAEEVLKRIPSDEKVMKNFPCGHVLLTTKFLRPDVVLSVSSWLTSKTAEQQTALLGSNPSVVSR